MEGTELAAWTGVALAALAVVTMVFIARRERRRKKLAYTLNIEEVGFGPYMLGTDIRISAGGRELTNAHFLVFTIRNIGNEPVVVDDFERDRPIVIHCAGADLIELGTQSHVPDLAVKVTEQPDGGIEIEPLMLKPGEGFALTALLEGRPGRPTRGDAGHRRGV